MGHNDLKLDPVMDTKVECWCGFYYLNSSAVALNLLVLLFLAGWWILTRIHEQSDT